MHPPDRIDPSVAAAMKRSLRARHDDFVHPDRHKDLRPEAKGAKTSISSRRYAGDGELAAIESNGTPDDCGIAAKAEFPRLVTEYRERIGARRPIGLSEQAPTFRSHSQHGEVVLRHHLSPNHVGSQGSA
jgi:hypothetical protein